MWGFFLFLPACRSCLHDPVLFLGSCEDSRAPVAGYFSSGHVPLPGAHRRGLCAYLGRAGPHSVGDNKEGRWWKVTNGHSGCRVFSMSSHVTGHHIYWLHGDLGAAGTGASPQNATKSQQPTSVTHFHRRPLRLREVMRPLAKSII